MQLSREEIRASERAHYIMQLASYFTELTDEAGVRFAYTNRLSDIWYNQAYDIDCNEDEFSSLMTRIETYFQRRERTPCIYLSPATTPPNASDLLGNRDYAQFESEAWMFYDLGQLKSDYVQPASISISEVTWERDFEMFADIYRRGLPGPEVEKYIDATREGQRYKPSLVDIRYFVGKYEGEPAGMISLLQIGRYAGVYAVATVEEFKKKGLARALNMHVCREAAANGADTIFLQTVSGEHAETVFQRLGYSTLYLRDGYTTRSAVEGLQHG